MTTNNNFHGANVNLGILGNNSGTNTTNNRSIAEDCQTNAAPPAEFLFDWKKEAPTGTEPQPSDQGNFSTCSSHALAKTLQAWLHEQKFDIKHDVLVNALLKKFPQAERIDPRNPQDFNGNEMKIIEKDDEGKKTGRKMRVQLKVQTKLTGGQPWIISATKDVLTSPTDMLAVGCLKLPQGNHAIYIRSALKHFFFFLRIIF